MAFRTQHLANSFPKWTKVRNDPSSLGYRLLSVYAEYFDFASMESKKISDELNLLKWHLGRPWAWRIQLEETDQLVLAVQPGGIPDWVYPTTVTGTHSEDGDVVLTRIESLEDLLWSVPNTVGNEVVVPYTNNLIWDSNTPTTYQEIVQPERLEVLVSGGTNYYKRTRFKNRLASGYHIVVITGFDVNGIEVVEHLNIVDDGKYLTRNIWSEITDVKVEGMDSRVRLYIHIQTGVDAEMLIDPYHVLASEDHESQAKISLSNDIIGYHVQRIASGENYRTGDPEVVDNHDLVWEQHLADSNDILLTSVIDCCIHPDTGRLYVLGTDVLAGPHVYVYEHGLTPFGPPALEDDITPNVFVEIQPLKPWAVLGETMTVFSWFRRPRFPVVGVEFSRRDPSGNIEYLQADKTTWDVVNYTFPGNNTGRNLPEESWQDIQFSTTFDEVGQWEFYCTTTTTGGNSVSYHGVMVDRLSALIELDILIANPTGIFFSESGKLVVATATDFHYLDERSHVYLANGRSQELFLREEYSQVEVVL